MDDRKKTDVRVTATVDGAVETIARQLGLPRNAVYMLGVALLAAQLTPILGGGTRKRAALLDKIEGEMRKMFEEAKKLA